MGNESHFVQESFNGGAAHNRRHRLFLRHRRALRPGVKADGWRVFATVRKTDDLPALEADGIETFLMDYARTETITELVGAVLERSRGRIDALFNNGAYGQPGASRIFRRQRCARSSRRISSAGTN